jgi:NAD(P)-dependent dehydrogenase (short-subunit alcohol dehydrogenase family)
MMSEERWTAERIPDLTGKVIIVTGGNTGLGLESVKVFAGKGAEVVLASRSVEKGDRAKSAVESGDPQGKVVVMQLDLTDLEGIKGFVAELRSRYNRLDILLNNAGIMAAPYFVTKDGFEGQMGTNHLGHFALTGQLLDLLIRTVGSRVVSVSSGAHKFGRMDFDNLLFENGKGYSPIRAYGRSKLANLLFTYELQRQFEKQKINSMAVAAHPGGAKTELGRSFERRPGYRLISPLWDLFSQSAAMGVLAQLRASADPDVKGGDYYGPYNGINGMTGYPRLVRSSAASCSREDAKKLWEISERLTGVRFQF